jgi:hypothetical protein
LVAQAELPVQSARRCDGAPERRFRPVPAHTSPPEWMKQPRFRRTTAVARYAVHAAAEALGETRIASVQSGAMRLGVVFCSMNGCVQFSRRFYTEVQDNPLLASPILFPETVYNAPSSHLAALVGSREINYTLVGDSAQFIAGLDLASQWIEDGLVDAALVVAAEELDWLTEEALRLFGKRCITSEGAAAVLLEPRTQANDNAPLLQHITRGWTYGANLSRRSASVKMQSSLASLGQPNAVLCDGLGAGARTDHPEAAAWKSWPGERVSVRRTLGEGFAVTSAWQTIAALEWLIEGKARQVLLSAVGLTQQANGASFGFAESVGEAQKSMEEPLSLKEHALAPVNP